MNIRDVVVSTVNTAMKTAQNSASSKPLRTTHVPGGIHVLLHHGYPALSVSSLDSTGRPSAFHSG